MSVIKELVPLIWEDHELMANLVYRETQSLNNEWINQPTNQPNKHRHKNEIGSLSQNIRSQLWLVYGLNPKAWNYKTALRKQVRETLCNWFGLWLCFILTPKIKATKAEIEKKWIESGYNVSVFKQMAINDCKTGSQKKHAGLYLYLVVEVILTDPKKGSPGRWASCVDHTSAPVRFP